MTEVDKKKNRLYLRLADELDAPEARKAGNAVIQAARELDRGFDVISDIAGLKSHESDITGEITRVHKAFIDMGVNRIIRIVGEGLEQDVVQTQFALASWNIGFDVEAVRSIEEADRVLDSAK